MRIRSQLAIGVSAVIAMLTVVALAQRSTAAVAARAMADSERAQRLSVSLASLASLAERAETGARDLTASGSDAARAAYEQGLAQLRHDTDDLAARFGDAPSVRSSVEGARRAIDQWSHDVAEPAIARR